MVSHSGSGASAPKPNPTLTQLPMLNTDVKLLNHKCFIYVLPFYFLEMGLV